jgi:aminoglycoside 3-N-acetyltransferase
MLTREAMQRQLTALGVRQGDVLMVHSSLSRLGFVEDGPSTCVEALLDSIGLTGTLVMPAFSPAVSDPASWSDPLLAPSDIDVARRQVESFNAATTPTSMGAIPETFRTWTGVVRSPHPQVSVCAKGVRADEIVALHDWEWGEGPDSPFQRLYEMDALVLLIGVGFNRATMLHYAESKVPFGRRKLRRIPRREGQAREWVEVVDVGDDLGAHFPDIGDVVRREELAVFGYVGEAECSLIPSRLLVNRAETYLSDALRP